MFSKYHVSECKILIIYSDERNKTFIYRQKRMVWKADQTKHFHEKITLEILILRT